MSAIHIKIMPSIFNTQEDLISECFKMPRWIVAARRFHKTKLWNAALTMLESEGYRVEVVLGPDGYVKVEPIRS